MFNYQSFIAVLFVVALYSSINFTGPYLEILQLKLKSDAICVDLAVLGFHRHSEWQDLKSNIFFRINVLFLTVRSAQADFFCYQSNFPVSPALCGACSLWITMHTFPSPGKLRWSGKTDHISWRHYVSLV